eukprot:gene562-1083_t
MNGNLQSLIKEVSMTQFPSWFERKMNLHLIIDLGFVNNALEEIHHHILFLETLTAKLRKLHSGPVSQPSQQHSRLTRFCDQLESLTTIQTPPALPDTESLKDYIQKVRSKLKTIDDMASSPKLFRKEADVDEISRSIRNTTHSIFECVDELEESLSKQSILTDHLGELNTSYLHPLSALLRKYEELPPALSANDVILLAQNIEHAEEAYNKSKSVDVLQQVARMKAEAEYIEGIVNAMLLPLRVAARASKAPSPRRETSSVGRVFLPMLTGAEENFFVHSANRSTTIDEFTSCLLELHTSAPSTITTSTPSSSSTNTSPLKASPTTNVSNDLRVAVCGLDLELFWAYMEDWKLRADTIAHMTVSSEFEKAYKKLVQTRLDLQRANEQYEQRMTVMHHSLNKFNEVKGELLKFQSSLKQLCISELNEDIDIVLPNDTSVGQIP